MQLTRSSLVFTLRHFSFVGLVRRNCKSLLMVWPGDLRKETRNAGGLKRFSLTGIGTDRNEVTIASQMLFFFSQRCTRYTGLNARFRQFYWLAWKNSKLPGSLSIASFDGFQVQLLLIATKETLAALEHGNTSEKRKALGDLGTTVYRHLPWILRHSRHFHRHGVLRSRSHRR